MVGVGGDVGGLFVNIGFLLFHLCTEKEYASRYVYL